MRRLIQWALNALALPVILLLPCIVNATPLPLFGPAPAELATPIQVYQRAAGDMAPERLDDLSRWSKRHVEQAQVDMLGGSFWLVSEFTPGKAGTDWVIAPANTFFDQAEIHVLGADGSHQQRLTGIGMPTEFLMHRGRSFELIPGVRYAIVIAIQTPFFTSLPRIDVQPTSDYRRRVVNESALSMIAIGALLALGTFILFVGIWIRDRSYLLYGGQSLCLAIGWAFYFNLPYGWLGINDPLWNFAPWFFLLTAFHASFCVRFLDLQQASPGLARIGRGITTLALVTLPICFLLPAYSHVVATLLVGSAVLFAVYSAVWSLANGARKARFFLAGYLAVLLPGLLILPANLGLVPDLIDNTDLLTLIGNSVEAMLLGFALADHVRLIERAREEFRRGMQDALQQASTDPLTGLGNRYAFNLALEQFLTSQRSGGQRRRLLVAMLDVDGLKRINDSEGHARGDALIRSIGQGLSQISYGRSKCFRMGGDEFAVISTGDESAREQLTQQLTMLDSSLRLKGFPNGGISFGVCAGPDPSVSLTAGDLAELLRAADRLMYDSKSRRRAAPSRSLRSVT